MTLNIAILASTNASDMPAIVEAIKNKKIDAKISIVLCNKECGAVKKAKQYNLQYKIIESKGKEREQFDKEVAEILENNNIELILLIGYMRYLSKWFVEKYYGKIMNIHPSLLPAFAGGMDKNVHQAVLEHGCKITGCTLHFVDEGADTGPIIMQKAVEISNTETADTLKQKVQKAEQEIIIKAIDLYSKGKIKLDGRKVSLLD